MGSVREFAVELTKRAGETLEKNFRKDRELMRVRRMVKDITTRYDKLVDEDVVRAIRENYPAHNILTEESGFTDLGSDYTWVVDSLDGTVNFASGNPIFCVNLALLKKDEPVLGVTYAPAIGELFVAEKGKGASLNQARISVSSTRELRECYAFFCEGGERDRARTCRMNTGLYPKVRDLRKLGSAGIEAAWVACGRGDAYVTTRIEPWDVAPGVLLVRESGGEVTDFGGRTWRAKKADLIFSNGMVHRRVLDLVRGL